jgi:hypothetical protein
VDSAQLDKHDSKWNLSHSAKKGNHRQSLHKDGKCDHGKTDRNDFFAQWNLWGKPKGKRER